MTVESRQPVRPDAGSATQGVFVVIPAYNESFCLEEVLLQVRSRYPNVVVVDDGSMDDTFAIARRLVPHALRHPLNRGQGAALQTGIEFALRQGARTIVTFDADGQHCVEDIAVVLEPVLRGDCDVVLGSRFLGAAAAIPRSRRWLLRAAALATRIVSRVRLTDVHNGLRAFSRQAAEGIHITMDRMAHASELIDILHRSGMAFREVPVRVRYTDYSLRKGQSSHGALRIVLDYVTGRMLR